MNVKQLFRRDGYGRTWIATNPSPTLVRKVLGDAFIYGYTVEISDYDLDPRAVGAA